MARVTIQHPLINSYVATTILCSSVTSSGKRSLDAKPNINLSAGMVDVQVVSAENVKYTLRDVYFTGVSNTLAWADVLSLYSSPTAATLNVVYDTNTSLTGQGGSANISVQLEQFSLDVNTKDSKNAYRPVASLTFVETD